MRARPTLRAPQDRGAAAPSRSPRRIACRSNSLHGQTELVGHSYPPVEAVRRALKLLKVTNELGIATVSDLHRMTGMAKPTVVRLLETLILEGYVDRDNMLGGYRVTSHVQNLSNGFQGTPLILEAARAWAVRLTQSILWPCGIGIPNGRQITVRFTTAAISPWSQPDSALNLQLDMERSAMGQCYLAFCRDDEREMLIDGLAAEGRATAERITPAALRSVRRLGFSVRDGRMGQDGIKVVAVPITNGGAAVACLSTSFYASTVPPSRIAESIVAPMRETVLNIERDITNLKSATSAPA